MATSAWQPQNALSAGFNIGANIRDHRVKQEDKRKAEQAAQLKKQEAESKSTAAQKLKEQGNMAMAVLRSKDPVKSYGMLRDIQSPEDQAAMPQQYNEMFLKQRIAKIADAQKNIDQGYGLENKAVDHANDTSLEGVKHGNNVNMEGVKHKNILTRDQFEAAKQKERLGIEHQNDLAMEGVQHANTTARDATLHANDTSLEGVKHGNTTSRDATLHGYDKEMQSQQDAAALKRTKAGKSGTQSSGSTGAGGLKPTDEKRIIDVVASMVPQGIIQMDSAGNVVQVSPQVLDVSRKAQEILRVGGAPSINDAIGMALSEAGVAGHEKASKPIQQNAQGQVQRLKGATDQVLVEQAKAAIKSGKDPKAVMQRLREMGVQF